MKVYLTVILLFCLFNITAQTFNGSVTYKIEHINTNLETKSDSSKWHFQKRFIFGDSGFMTQRYFFHSKRYLSEVIIKDQLSIQLYIPERRTLYSWLKDSKTASTIDVGRFGDNVTDIEYSKEKKTIIGISCNLVILTFRSEKKLKIWYNKDYFKINVDLLEDHHFNNLSEITKVINCLPFSIEESNDDLITIQSIIDYKEEIFDKTKFELPEFKEIIIDGKEW